jgi:glycosyltransferase involved in cell wall biosynthesis
MSQVLIVSHDIVDAQMAGPGIRYYHLARVLARDFEVTLAIPAESTLEMDRGVTLLPYHSGHETVLAQAAKQARAMLIPAIMVSRMPALKQSLTPMVVDGYDPYLAETLSLQKGETAIELQTSLTEAYLRGDFYICASERQRDWWLGLLEANGRVNAHTFGADPSLRSLVDVVPFGMPTEPPRCTSHTIQDMWPSIKKENRIILWGGGLWSWLDPLTAIRAMAKIGQHRSDVRLIFPGTRHPNPGMADMPTNNELARQTAQEMGLMDKLVFFGDWVPYTDWPNVLLESDLALTLHHDTLETRLAFRSRVLEYIWAGLPTVATRGDATSDLVARYGIGAVVDYGDVDSVCEAILRLLETDRKTFAERFEHAHKELTWEQAAQPLLSFCHHPRRAPDKTKANGHPGNPYYVSKTQQMEELIAGYERGRFIRLMRWLKGLRVKIGGGK